MAHEQKVDYEIIHSLNSLLEFELQETLKESDFQTYKGKSKALLSKLLLKLEDNFEYQKYLEHEVIKLEESAECAVRIGVHVYDEKCAEIAITEENNEVYTAAKRFCMFIECIWIANILTSAALYS